MDERIIIKTDGEIDLTIPKDFEEYDNTFDIYLHDTDDFIGTIWFDEGNDEDFSKYCGNVGYDIKKQYRGNNYALKALKLLKDVMLDDDIKNMIFSISPDNIASRRTAEKFGARILCYRPIPKNHRLYDFSENKRIIYICNIGENEDEKNKTKYHL